MNGRIEGIMETINRGASWQTELGLNDLAFEHWPRLSRQLRD